MPPTNLTSQQQHSLDYVNSQPTPAPTGQGSFLGKLLPTAGGVLGGLAGTLLDPITMGMGTIAGSALGSALGQGAENGLEGTNGSVLGAGAEGALGGVLGGLGGKVLGAGKSALGNIIEGQGAKAADAAYMAPFKGIENSAVAKSNDLNSTANLMKSLDVQGTPQAWQDAASVGTGRKGLGAMTNALDTITTNAGQLPSDNIIGRVTNALQEAGVDPNSKDLAWLTGEKGHLANMTSTKSLDAAGNELKPTTVATTGGIEGKPGGEGFSSGTGATSVQEQVDAPTLLKTIQTIDNQIAPYHNPNVNLTVADSAKLQGLQNAKSELENTLYGNGIDSAVAAHTVDDTTAKQILDAAGGNQKLANYVIDGINNAKTGAELRSAQAPLVQASILGRAGNFQAAGQLPGTLEGQTAKAVNNATGDIVPQAVKDTASAVHPGAGLVAGLVNKFGEAGLHGAAKLADGVPTGMLPVLAQLGAHTPSLGADGSASGNMGQDGNTMNAYQTQAPDSPTGPSMAWAGEFAPGMIPAMEQAQKAQAAQPVLNSLEQSYSRAGGAQGAGSGLLSQLSSLVPGTAAYQYNQQKLQAAASLAKATGLDIHSVLAALPSLMADQSGAQNEFSGVQGALGQMQGMPQFGQPSVLAGMPAQ